MISDEELLKSIPQETLDRYFFDRLGDALLVLFVDPEDEDEEGIQIEWGCGLGPSGDNNCETILFHVLTDDEDTERDDKATTDLDSRTNAPSGVLIN